MFNLYWVTTKLYPEDWFIVAKSKDLACECHENNEGFELGCAHAEFICKIPMDLERKYRTEYDEFDYGYWPSIDLLKELGFEFIEDEPPYVVRKNGKLYYMGESCYGMAKEHFIDQNGVYIVQIRRTNKYKIGITNNITRRLKEFKTTNPFTVDLIYFIITDNTRFVEREFHDLFRNNIIGGEWFELEKLDDILNAFKIIEQKYTLNIFDIKRFIGR